MAGLQATGGRGFWRLDWSAVIAGVLLAVAAHIVLGLIGAALGFAAAPSDSRGLGAGAAAWALVAPFVASLLGAWLACRMAGTEDRAAGNLHGILVWCIGLIAGALFLTGTIASGAMSAGTAASGNLGAAQRLRGETGLARADGVRAGDSGGRDAAARERSEDAAKAAAAGSGAAALASIAGLLGAIAGSGISRRREGRGWNVGLARRHERERPATFRTGERAPSAYGSGVETHAAPPPAPTSPGAGVPPADPYHPH